MRSFRRNGAHEDSHSFGASAKRTRKKHGPTWPRLPLLFAPQSLAESDRSDSGAECNYRPSIWDLQVSKMALLVQDFCSRSFRMFTLPAL